MRSSVKIKKSRNGDIILSFIDVGMLMRTQKKIKLLLRIIYVFSVLCLLCICARLFICAFWSPAGKGLASWLSFVVSDCEFVTFPFGILGQVWYLIVSIPDLCTLTYFLTPVLLHLIINRVTCITLQYLAKT